MAGPGHMCASPSQSLRILLSLSLSLQMFECVCVCDCVWHWHPGTMAAGGYGNCFAAVDADAIEKPRPL